MLKTPRPGSVLAPLLFLAAISHALPAVASAARELNEQIRSGWTALDQHYVDNAAAAFTQALELIGNVDATPDVELSVFAGAGRAALEQRNLGSARRDFERAIEVIETSAITGPRAASSYRGLALIELIDGNPERAMELLQQGLERLPDTDEGEIERAAITSRIGFVMAERGDVARAEPMLLEAVERVDRVAPRSLIAGGVRNNLAFVYYKRGDYDTAAELYRQALDAYSGLNPQSSLIARARFNLAISYGNGGEHAKAVDALRELIKLQEKIVPNSSDLARSWHSLSIHLDKTDRRKDALEASRIATDIYERSDVRGFMYLATKHRYGGLLVEEKQYEAGRKILRRIVADAGAKYPYTKLEADAAYMLAVAHRELGDAEDALSAFEVSLRSAEGQLQRLGGDDVAKVRFAELYADVYQDAIEMLLDNRREKEAFRLLERWRGQAFLAIAQSENETLLRRLPATLKRKRESILSQFRSNASVQPADVKTVRDEFRELQNAARSATPSAAAVLFPEAMTAQEVSAQLASNQRLLSYVFTRKGLRIFVVGPTGQLTVRLVEIPREELTAAVKGYRVLTQLKGPVVSDNLIKRGRILEQALLRPIADLIEDSDELIIVPDGPLWLLPFAALPYGENWLVANFATEVSMSATVRFLERGTVPVVEPRRTLVLADPVGAQGPPLPGARREARQIDRLFGGNADVLVGRRATAESLLSTGRDVGIVHLAMHAVTNAADPMSSYLDIPNSAGANERLSAGQIIEQLSLAADLVTLSGCDTALGQSTSGEGVLGLTRAFQLAGARNVLSSHWRVSDSSTAVLMTHFYSRVLAGEPHANALRDAQLEMLRGGTDDALNNFAIRASEATDSEYAHPYHWAAFGLFVSS